MKAILSADKNWGIGCQNKLLISIPSDMKFFRETTAGHTVIMGRKTLESLPGRAAPEEPQEYCSYQESRVSGQRSRGGSQS